MCLQLSQIIKIALAVSRTDDYPTQNIRRMSACVREASENGARLVVFTEAAPTGLINNGSVVHDLMLGMRQDSERFLPLLRAVREGGLMTCFGYLELFGGRLCDTAVCLDEKGQIAAKYRRRTPGWRDPHIENVYGEGRELCQFDTPAGKTALLLGGDVFDDGILEETAALSPALTLLPIAAQGNAPVSEQQMETALSKRAKLLGSPLIAVNGFGGGFYGGGYAFDASGKTINRLLPGAAGIIYIELPAKKEG